MPIKLSGFNSPPRNNKHDAIFISFEGIEGAGKSTQIQLLKDHLESQGLDVTVMREPGGTKAGEKLRDTILKSDEALTPLTETLIFLASRCELLSQRILPLLEKQKQVVILDRYIDSTISYQGFGRGLGVERILKLHDTYPLNTLPHKTFFLHINEDTSRLRQGVRGDDLDYFEKENSEFYTQIQKGFEETSELFKDRVIKIDASGDIQAVHKLIIHSWEENFS